MTALGIRSDPSPELRTSAFYFTQFMSVGVANAFAGIWMSSLGFAAERIGVINAVPIFTMLVIQLLIGRIADRASDWRQTIVVCSLASAVAPIGLFFVRDFWGVLLFWSLSRIAQMATVPVADAATMRMCRRRGSEYATVRAWGSLGYLLTAFAMGFVVMWGGTATFVPLFAGTSLMRGIASLGLPRFRTPEVAAGPSASASRMRDLMRPWFLLPLIGYAMIFATNLVLDGFMGLLFMRQGIAAEMVGALIALGTLSETVLFFAFRRLALPVSARGLILFAGIVSAFRWTAMAFSPPLEALFALQLLHAITYGLGFLGCINFIANWTRDNIAAQAQGLFTVLNNAMAVLALSGFGWLVGMFETRAYLGTAAMAAIGAGLIFVSRRFPQPDEPIRPDGGDG